MPPPPSAKAQACVPSPAAGGDPKEAEGDAGEQKHLYDPARTRLGIMSTAEVLGHGEWEIAGRNIVGMLELGVGLGDRFQLTAKTSPITWFVPGIDMGLKNALWMAEIKAQIWRSPKFKLTAELSYFHVANVHGVRPGLSMKIGGDHIAFHAGVGTQLLIFPAAQAEVDGPTYSDCGADASTTYDCGGVEQGSRRSHDVHPVGYATAGLEVRFWRYGKFFVEGFVAGARGTPTLAGVVPGVRFHNGVFAADLGLGVLHIDEDDVTVPLPVLNFSWRW